MGAVEVVPAIVVVAAVVFAGFLSLRNASLSPADRYLCDTCKFNAPDLCKRSERPKALVCEAYSEGSLNQSGNA